MAATALNVIIPLSGSLAAMGALTGLKITPFTVAGKINSGAFQKAKAIAVACDASASATVIPLLPADYDKLLLKLQSEHGGPAYLHEAGVAVYSEVAGFIGDDVAFIKWLEANRVGGISKGVNSNGKAINFDMLADKEYETLVCESDLTFAFLELSFDGEKLGRLVFQLYPNLAPKTVENFLALCEEGYAGTPIHRVKPGGWLQGGDVVTGNGDGGKSASGSPIPDESFHIKHCEYGILGMANDGEHTAQSQFYCTFAPTPSFDKTFCAFGKLADGTKLLQFVEEMDCVNDRPRAELLISACGKVKPLTDLEKKMMRSEEDVSATKLQAMHRGRQQRKERAEKKAAAARIAAVKRGQKARQEMKEQKEAATKVQAISRGRKARKK